MENSVRNLMMYTRDRNLMMFLVESRLLCDKELTKNFVTVFRYDKYFVSDLFFIGNFTKLSNMILFFNG